MTNSFMIGNREVGPNRRPLVVAEMSGNHNQSLETALAIVDAAARAGVEAVKLQTYTPDTMTLNISSKEFVVQGTGGPWDGLTLYELYRRAHTPWEWHAPIVERARQHGMLVFSTPFDETAVDFLEAMQMPCYKIASFEVGDVELLARVARTGKPLLISTGMATLSELDRCVATVRENGCRELLLLKCTSAYPATADHANLASIPHLRELFDCQVGLSDHTPGLGVAVAATVFGATLIEKHFTLSRADGGVDSEFSMEPGEMAVLVAETERAWRSVGRVAYGVQPAEQGSRQFRRSLYFVRDLPEGAEVGPNDLRSIRPGFGLAPHWKPFLLGKRVRCSVSRGTPVSWGHF